MPADEHPGPDHHEPADELDWDALRAAGLYDPDAPAAEDRAELLRELAARGATLDQMRHADAIGRLPALASDLLIMPKPVYTLTQLAEVMGGDQARAAAAIRAAGLAVPDDDEVALGEDDLALFAALVPALDLLPEEAAISILRVIGSSLARIADASVTAYLDTVERHIVARGGSEIEHMRSLEAGIQVMAGVVDTLGTLMVRHLWEAIDRSRRAREGLERFDTVRMAVGFVDLSGFTPLAQQVGATALGELVADFEATAFDLVADNDGRVVKLIGDEVMFVALEPAQAAAIALDLVDAFRNVEHRPTPRGGLAFGELIVRGGDYYGPQVNLASRIATESVPLEVLIPESMRDELLDDDRFVLEPAGRRMLKGLIEPVRLWSLERA